MLARTLLSHRFKTTQIIFFYNEEKTHCLKEINFTKYFYEFKPLRPLAEIKADILALEEKTLETEKTILES